MPCDIYCRVFVGGLKLLSKSLGQNRSRDHVIPDCRSRVCKQFGPVLRVFVHHRPRNFDGDFSPLQFGGSGGMPCDIYCRVFVGGLVWPVTIWWQRWDAL